MHSLARDSLRRAKEGNVLVQHLDGTRKARTSIRVQCMAPGSLASVTDGREGAVEDHRVWVRELEVLDEALEQVDDLSQSGRCHLWRHVGVSSRDRERHARDGAKVHRPRLSLGALVHGWGRRLGIPK